MTELTTGPGRPAIVATADYHTAGEPFRIVTGGVPFLAGRTVADRRISAMSGLDHIRRLLVQEPRGHPGMYGCFVTPPDDGGAEFGAVFFHQSGFSTACGHGTIALATWAVEAGLVAPDRRSFNIDVPSGRVGVRLPGGRHPAVTFLNVPAWVHRRAVPVQTPAGLVHAGIAFGGAFYASLPASALGLRVDVSCLPQLTEAGRAVQQQL
ncbi:MAG: proline racemase family protein, partial [Actinomycetota bacterium]